MRRAIVIYLENLHHLIVHFACLYTSLEYIRSPDTELVVFGTPEALKRLPHDCRKIEFLPLEEPPEMQTYRYINSIACLTGPQAEQLQEYDYILRTDADVFLTPAWNTYYPKAYTVGRGLYVNGDTVKRNILRVAGELGLNHHGFFNTGSTHYGAPEKVCDVCRVGLEVNRYLLTHDFKKNHGAWPGWFRGVSILYSMEIAVNHVMKTPVPDYCNLDFDSISAESVENHAHIHCWHVETQFSKYHFLHGKYDSINPENLNPGIIKDYCLYNALLSKQRLPDLSRGS